jgi:hypothetical protein
MRSRRDAADPRPPRESAAGPPGALTTDRWRVHSRRRTSWAKGAV